MRRSQPLCFRPRSLLLVMAAGARLSGGWCVVAGRAGEGAPQAATTTTTTRPTSPSLRAAARGDAGGGSRGGGATERLLP